MSDKLNNTIEQPGNGEGMKIPTAIIPEFTLFPGTLALIDLNQNNEKAMAKALAESGLAFVVSSTSKMTKIGVADKLCTVGTVVRVVGINKSERDKNIKAAKLEGLYRATSERYFQSREGILHANVIRCEETDDLSEKETVSYKLFIMNLLAEYSKKVDSLYGGFLKICIATETVGKLCDFVAANIRLLPEARQSLLETVDARTRADLLLEAVKTVIEVEGLEGEIEKKLQARLEKHQRDYQLREKMAVIAEELGDGDNMAAEAGRYREAVKKSGIPEQYIPKLMRECDRLAKMSSLSPDAAVIRGYLESCLSLPWKTSTKDKTNISAARKKLDRDHYGLEEVKKRILEQLCVYTLTGNTNAQILCLAGPPGVGKTSVARSVAEAMGRNFVRISLGGVKDEAEIRGHRRTYIGSMPGRIVSALIQAGSNNPVILLDEVDKMGYDYKGDPSTALLEVLDPEQNGSFTDHFIDLPFDLSKVLFITTANNKGDITPPLLDRMEVIDIPGYTDEEKYQIAKRHLIKKQAKKHGLEPSNIKMSEKAVYSVIEGYTREAGVRSLEKQIATLCRKAAAERVENGTERFSITPEKAAQMLGPAKYKSEAPEKSSLVGVCNGLAWTSVGGELLKIEVAVLEGTGKIQLTGQLGDVMKESAMAAITYIRSRCGRLGIDSSFYEKKDIHIHVPEGAVPKDGPSAGVTLATAIVSALTRIPVRADVAMTGEITLRGRVLAIGGLREKSMAAYKNGINTVIIPLANEADIAQTASAVQEKIKFITASCVDTVLENALDYAAREPEPDCRQDEHAIAAHIDISGGSRMGVHNEI